jgi:hypothetical protein
MIFKRVDLPAPFSPTSPTTSPSLRYRVTSVSAGFPAKSLADSLEVKDATDGGFLRWGLLNMDK